MSSKMISIPVEEYKALLAKEVPTDKDRMLMDAITETIKDYSRIVDKDSYSSDFKGLEFQYETKCLVEIVSLIYGLDRPRFLAMYKELVADKKEQTVNELNAAYMRRMKELKNDGTEA